ncbi:hypothetical protein [Streptomyces mirabilis]|uniref:hypothetical protein n=1 Tax=Streptomyces mirabilis TaxID=68239 RepID=UPI00368F6D19
MKPITALQNAASDPPGKALALLTGNPKRLPACDELTQDELSEILRIVTHTGASCEALMRFRATVLREDAKRREAVEVARP